MRCCPIALHCTAPHCTALHCNCRDLILAEEEMYFRSSDTVDAGPSRYLFANGDAPEKIPDKYFADAKKLSQWAEKAG